MSVPAFGEWDQLTRAVRRRNIPSIDFSKIRENRRRSKSHVSAGDDEGQFFAVATSIAAKSDPADADRVGGCVGYPVRGIHRPIRERPMRGRSRSPKVSLFLFKG